MILNYRVCTNDSAKSLKEILIKKMNISKNLITILKQNNKILLNNLNVNINFFVIPGDKITILLDHAESTKNIEPQNMPLEILYEDDSIIALNKPPHIVVHPTYNHPSGTLANALAYYFAKTNQSLKIRPVSRLDKGTSGIVIFAKNQYVQDCLAKQMKTLCFKKEYIGIVKNHMPEKSGTINLPIARKPGSIISRYISPSGAPSITHYKILRLLKYASIVKFNLETGRTHQIRVHCQSVGTPLIGDTLYGESSSEIRRQALHSAKVKLIHPKTKKHLKLYSPLPYDIKGLLKSFI